MTDNYWESCIKEAFEDTGIVATSEQIDEVISWVEGAHENYGMAHGHDCIPNPLKEENEKLKSEIKREQNKTICPKCNGKGNETISGPVHSGTSTCWKCHGEGFIYYDR